MLRLQGVHHDLVKVLELAITKTPVQFEIIQAIRTADEEMQLWLSCHNIDGSRNAHPWKTNCNGYPIGELAPNGIQGTGVSNHQGGLAIDFGALVDGNLSWDTGLYSQIANAILAAGAILNIPVIWGGNFLKPDPDHIELNRNFYKGI